MGRISCPTLSNVSNVLHSSPLSQSKGCAIDLWKRLHTPKTDFLVSFVLKQMAEHISESTTKWTYYVYFQLSLTFSFLCHPGQGDRFRPFNFRATPLPLVLMSTTAFTSKIVNFRLLRQISESDISATRDAISIFFLEPAFSSKSLPIPTRKPG